MGSRIEWPWDVIAKTQWILKAIELGSHAALSPLSTDREILDALETFGPRIFDVRRPIFQTPDVDWDTLIFRLREFGEMGDGDVSKILPLVAPEEESPATREAPEQGIEESEDPEMAQHKRAVRSFLRKFTLTRGADLDVLDSDAFDLDYGKKADIVQSVYSNRLEDFVSFAERDGLEAGSERLRYYMAVAIMNGSLEVVRYIVERYGASPNDVWGDATDHYTHFEDAVMFGRRKIVKFFLDHDAKIPPATRGRLSALHLALRHDDELLIRMFCEYLKTHGNLQDVLESKPAGGEYPSCTPAGLAMDTGAWKAVKVLLEYGANVNVDSDGKRLLDSAVRPRSPACPTDVLQAILQNGAEIDVIPERGHPPLQWAISTGNVLAALHLLLQGASLHLSDKYDFMHEAMEVAEEWRDGRPLEVLDEDEKPLVDSWRYAREASELILEMVRVTSAREDDWEAHIQDLVLTRAQKCKGKMWIVIGKEPLMSAVELRVPAAA